MEAAKFYTIEELVEIIRQELTDDSEASTDSTSRYINFLLQDHDLFYSNSDNTSLSSFEMIDEAGSSKSSNVPIELIGDRVAQVEYHGAADADRLALCDAQLVKSVRCLL